MDYIFVYHSIHPDSTYRQAVKPQVFERQLDIIKKHCQMVPLETLRQSVMENRQAPRQPRAAVTFDDGYQDNYDYAYPILKAKNIPATIFVITDVVGKTFYDRPMLNWSTIRQMQAEGLVSIQSHTHTHPVLPTLSSEALRHECVESKVILERELGARVTSIAYPKGKYTKEILPIIRETYRYGFGTNGPLEGSIDALAIPRINIDWRTSPLKIRLMMHPLFWRLRQVFGR